MRALYAYCVLVVAALAAPILVVVAASFTAGETIGFPPQGFSLRWYRAYARDPEFLAALWTSLEVAVLTALAATGLGTAAAIALARHRIPGRRVIEAFLALPLGIPSVVLGLAFLVSYTQLGFGGTLGGIVAGHVVYTTPFVLRLVSAGFAQHNPSLERAAAGLGAPPHLVFWHVTLPAIRAGVIGGAVFAAIMSFDEVVIALFLSGPDAVTLPVRIFTTMDQSPGPVVMAAGSVLVGLAVAVFALLEATVGVSRAFGLGTDGGRRT